MPLQQPAATRVWCHLDHALPLMAHAMACLNHTATRAQADADLPLRPALIWHDTGTSGVWYSNGSPGWHDANGTPVTATIATWHDRSTPRSARPAATGGGRHGYLPLTALTNDAPRMYDYIRLGHLHGNRWLSVLFAADTALPVEVATRAAHGDPYPPDATWTTAEVTCDDLPGRASYPALIADRHTTTDGGELCRFDTTVVQQMVLDHLWTDSATPGHTTVLRWRGPELDIYRRNPDGVLPRLRRVDVVAPDDAGLYPVGAYLWRWRTTTDTANQP